MNKYKNLLLFMVMLCVTVAKAQDARLSVKDEQASAQVGMDKKKFATFSKNIRQYNKRIVTVLRDSTLTRDQQRAAAMHLRAERKQYIEQNLNADQQKKWTALQKQNRPQPSPAHQKMINARKKLAEKKQNLNH